MAAVSLFWDTNMAAVTSCENALYTGNELQAQVETALDKFSIGLNFLSLGVSFTRNHLKVKNQVSGQIFQPVETDYSNPVPHV